MALINGIWKYAESDTVAPTFSELLNLLGDSVRDQLALVNPAWQAYTPVLTNMTLGNGSVAGRYQRIGNTVRGRALLTFGSTTVVGVNPAIGLPAQQHALLNSSAVGPIGTAHVVDASAGSGSRTGGVAVFAGPASATVILDRVGTTYTTVSTFTAAFPWTWAAGDTLAFEFTYEAA